MFFIDMLLKGRPQFYGPFLRRSVLGEKKRLATS